MKYLSVLFLCLFICVPANAATVTLGNPLPHLVVADKGEVRITAGTFTWEQWSSSNLNGRVHVIEHLAARMSARKINQAFMDTLDARFPKEKLYTTTLVNMSDALWGTSSLVPGELQKKKKQRANDVWVADAKGDSLIVWGLKRESSAIVVLDKTGKVAFFKEGALTKTEIDSTIKLIGTLLESR